LHFEKDPMVMNGAYYLPLPIDLVRFLGIEEKGTIIIQDEEGKHGRYASFWKKEEKKK